MGWRTSAGSGVLGAALCLWGCGAPSDGSFLGGATAPTQQARDLGPADPNHLDVTILGTTDAHGHIYPTDYDGSDQGDAPVGLARVETEVKAIRSQRRHTLLVDSGDALEGTALDAVNALIDPGPNPMVQVMNAMGYDAFALGNHDYNFGIPYLMKARSEARFPFMSGNIYRHGTSVPVFEPYRIFSVGGARIAILALTTPGIALWDKDHVQGQQDFGDIVQAAGRWLPEIKAKGADATVVIIHSGLGAPYDQTYSGYSAASGLPPENVTAALAQAFPQIDAILCGHSHKDLSQLLVNGVVVTQALKWGERLADVELHLDRTPTGAWKVTGKSSTTLDTTALTPDPDILEVARPAHEATEAYVQQTIGTAATAMSAAAGPGAPDPLVDLLNAAQRARTGADLSATSAMPTAAQLPQGAITIADIFGVAPYENTLFKVQVTGAQLRAYLEWSARFFAPYAVGAAYVDPNVPAHDFDVVQGVDYAIDVTRPVGQRIVGLAFHGAPVVDTQTFSMALNSYREAGGGGYTMAAQAPVLQAYAQETRDVLIDWIKQAGTVVPAALSPSRWGVVPAGAVVAGNPSYQASARFR